MTWPDIELNTGAKIPGIGFGSAGIPKANTSQNTLAAFSAGFSHIDTAQAYRNEEEVGQALKDVDLSSRSDVWVTTKWSGFPWGDGGSIDPLSSVKQSLQKLGLKSLDLYLVHTPRLFAKTGIKEGWKQIESLQKAGYTRHIGVSNFTIENMQELLEGDKHSVCDVEEECFDEKIEWDDADSNKHNRHNHGDKKHSRHHQWGVEIVPAVNQIELHPYVWAQYKANVEYCQSKGVAIEAYSPLKPLTSYPGGPIDGPVNQIAEKFGVKPEQVLLAWIRSKGAIALTTSRSPERLQAYIDAGGLQLGEDDIRYIEESAAGGPPSRLATLLRSALVSPPPRTHTGARHAIELSAWAAKTTAAWLCLTAVVGGVTNVAIQSALHSCDGMV